MSGQSSTGGGIGCLTIIGIVFVILKLAKVGAVAAWSWWWVLSPFILQAVFVFAIVALVALCAFIAWALK